MKRLRAYQTSYQPLLGQVVWITGSTAGIGLALARQAAMSGASVVLSAPDEAGLKQAKQQCDQFGGDHLTILLDVLDVAACELAYKYIMSHYGRLDWLINNAGITHRSKVLDTSSDMDDKIFALDYKAPIRLSRLVLPHLLSRKRGTIVMVSSIVGLVGTQDRSSYAAAKAALHLWANCLRAEVGSVGVKVKVVFPGFVKTNITLSALMPDGGTYGKLDAGQANAMTAEQFAAIAWQKLLGSQNFIVIGGLREKVGVWLARISPELLYKVIRRIEVK